MPDVEELEHRVTRLEALYEEVLKEKLTAITERLDRVDARFDRVEARLDQLYEKTERDKTEILTKLYEKTERDKTEVLTKTEKDKRELIYWMAGLSVGFLTLAITAMWAILSFAIKQ